MKKTVGPAGDEMRTLALLGARARIAELEAERDRLIALFPEMGKRRISPKAVGPSVVFDASDDALAPARAAANPAETKRRALAMRHEGKPVGEIAETLGLSENW